MTTEDSEVPYDAYSDPIANYIHASLVGPGLVNFATRRPDASELEMKAASTLLVLAGLAITRLSRLSTKLDTVQLAPGGTGDNVSDYRFVPTTQDTPEGREAAALELDFVMAADDTPPAPAIPAELEERPTSARWGHFGTYL